MIGSAFLAKGLLRRAGVASAAVLIAGAGLAASATWSDSKAESTLERLRKQGFARIAIANEPPWTQVTTGGKVTGAAPEVARAVLRKLGVKDVEASIAEYGAMIPGLQAGRFDLVAAGLYIKPQRCAAVIFSEPDLCDAEAFMVKKGNPMGLTSYQDLVTKKAKVGVPGGGTEEKLALNAGVPRSRVIVVPDGQSGVKMLQDGRIDAYALPILSLTALKNKAKDPNLEIYAPVKGVAVYCAGAAFNKRDREFRDAYDKALKELKASGEFKTIVTKFGFNASAPDRTSRTKLCGGKN